MDAIVEMCRCIRGVVMGCYAPSLLTGDAVSPVWGSLRLVPTLKKINTHNIYTLKTITHRPFRSTRRHTYPYITAPVTCLQHCGLCTKEFLERFHQASQTQVATC